MLDAEEKRWVKSTANQLNNLLQVITESAQFLESTAPQNADTYKYADILRNSVERTSQVIATMLEHVGEQPRGYQPQVSIGQPVPSSEPAPAAQAKAPAHEPQPEGTMAYEAKIINPDGQRELILIVDDEAFVTMLAQRVLTDEGYRVVTARDGFECLKIYKELKEKIALVIMDFTMPIMDGSEVFDELRAINPRVGVVLSSGFTEQEKLRGMLAKGLRGFIPKPYTQQKLLLQVRSTLDALKNER
jgi:CheY-like chemotaxis protein